MNRLTQKDEQGNWCLRGLKWDDLREGNTITRQMRERLYGALWRLMEYEETGLSPEGINNLNDFEASNTRKYLAELAKHRWIPVKERLPKDSKKNGIGAGEWKAREDNYFTQCNGTCLIRF